MNKNKKKLLNEKKILRIFIDYLVDSFYLNPDKNIVWKIYFLN